MEIAKTFDSYYSNKKFDPTKPFVLLNKYKLADDSGAWAKQKAGLMVSLSSLLLFLAVLIVPVIFFPDFLANYLDPNPLLFLLLLFSFTGGLIFVTVKTLDFFLKIDIEINETVSLERGGIRASFVYAVRSWLNSRYDLKLTNDHVISLLTNERTPYAGEKYKLVYDDNKSQIIDLLIDNSCPSGCCDKENVDIFKLSSDTQTFSK